MQQDHEEPSTNPSDDFTRAFVRLSSLPICPLDRLSRYEAPGASDPVYAAVSRPPQARGDQGNV
jgi:hypothetical protein